MMTKDEFIKLVVQQPLMAEESVYKLSVYTQGPMGVYEQSEADEWENFLTAREKYYFSNRQKAEFFLHILCMNHPSGGHSALIERCAVDTCHKNLPLEWWLYDSKGNLVDQSVCSAYHCYNNKTIAGKYLGRRPEQLRFKKGDIVEVIGYDRSKDLYVGTLGIVIHTPGTIEEEWEYFDSWQKEEREYLFNSTYPCMGYFHDHTDDRYGYLTGCFGEDALTCTVVKPTLPVPTEVEQELRDYAASHEAWLRAMKNPALSVDELKEIQRKHQSKQLKKK